MTGVLRLVAGWLARAAGVLLGAATLAFVAMQLIPGDPARAIVGSAPATEQTMAAIRAEMGLDLPLAEQYLRYLARLARGDLGRSFQIERPVAEVLGEQVWPTVQLAVCAIGLALAGALLVAVLTAGRRGRGTVALAELVALSTPTFWLGLVLLSVFSFRLGLLPVGDGEPASLVLPSLTLAVPLGATLTQVLREGLEHALEQPFVTTALARGASGAAVRVRHALRHALIPMVTLSGWLLGGLFGGAVLVETVFARQGLGRVTLAAVVGRDFPVVIAVVMLSALVFVVVNTLVDVAYLLIDPRLRPA
ncbi:ABC transporter permease [Nonomuraea insulae]|uniref:ABC transporter permease n=1 Tax=Nonomuraea insulae TaxID=1616787 RepID=A0ABW1CRB4_9ACTN